MSAPAPDASPDASPSLVRRVAFGVLRGALGVAVLVLLTRSGTIRWAALLELAGAWQLVALALGILLFDLAVTASRLSLLLRPVGFRLPLEAAVRLSLIGLFFNLFLPGGGGGDVVRILYAVQGNAGRRTEVATIMVLDRVLGLYAMLLLPVLVAPLFVGILGPVAILRAFVWAGVVGALVMTGMFVVALSPLRESRPVTWLLGRLPLGGYATRVLDTVRTFRAHVGVLVAAVAISLTAHALSVTVIALLAEAMSPGSMAWVMFFVIPLGFMANAVPLTPGGLGVGEAAFERLFALAGLAGGAEAMLAWRVISLVPSLLGLVVWVQGRRRFVEAADAPGAPPGA